MRCTVCTIFTIEFDVDLAVLANSLFANSYRGVVWVGVSGPLPSWAGSATQLEKYSEFNIAEEFYMRFIPIEQNTDLTSFKPEFMLAIANSLSDEQDALVYIDPDVIIDGPWSLFEEWISFGIAMAADARECVPSMHPCRLAWQRRYEQFGLCKRNSFDIYISDSFIGVQKKELRFLEHWKRIHQQMATSMKEPVLGQLESQNMSVQTSLNAALETTSSAFSLMAAYTSLLRPPVPLFYHNAKQPKAWSGALLPKGLRPLAPTIKSFAYKDGPIKVRPTCGNQVLDFFLR